MTHHTSKAKIYLFIYVTGSVKTEHKSTIPNFQYKALKLWGAICVKIKTNFTVIKNLGFIK